MLSMFQQQAYHLTDCGIMPINWTLVMADHANLDVLAWSVHHNKCSDRLIQPAFVYGKTDKLLCSAAVQ